MNVTLNTAPQYRYKQLQTRPAQNFTANYAATAEKAAENGKSLFEPFTRTYDKMTDWLAEHFTKHLVDSSAIQKVSDKLKNTNNLLQHCLTMGSAITSGLYMQRTLTNDKLDKDRKNTLAVNQGLTFAVSTAGAYTLDKYLKNWWENVTAKYVGHQMSDKTFAKDFTDIKLSFKQINKALKKDSGADVNKLAQDAKKSLNISDDASKLLDGIISKASKDSEGGKIKSLKALSLDKFTDKLVENKRITKASEELSNKIKGMGILRTMIIFGFVYRYFVPVAVTKPANILCEKYLENKKAKLNKNA